MNKNLQELVELSEYDKQLDSFVPRIKKITANLDEKKSEIDVVVLQIEEITSETEELKIEISRTNIHIEEFAAKIKDIKKKSGAVKTEKEMKALSLEEELAKEQLEASSEEIIRLEKIISLKDNEKIELENKQKEFEKEYEALNQEIKAELETIENDRTSVSEKKEKLTKEIDEKLFIFYEKIRKWAKNTAVVPIKKHACYGCFMKLTDRVYSSVINSDDIVTCPHCGRILYKEDETIEA